MEIGAFCQCYKQPMALRYSLQLFRNAYPTGTIVLVSDNGCDFRIKVEKQGDFPTYVSSKFGMPKAIEGMDDGKAKEVYDSITDLETVFTVKSFDELKEMLNEHFYCLSTDEVANVSTSTTIIENKPTETSTTKETSEPVSSTTNNDESDDDDIANLLNSLEDIK